MNLATSQARTVSRDVDELHAGFQALVSDLARADVILAGGQTYLSADMLPSSRLGMSTTAAYQKLLNRVVQWVQARGVAAEILYHDSAKTLPSNLMVRLA